MKPLEEAGFEKNFGIYGTEKTLTYEKGSIKLTLMWELPENPWFVIRCEETQVSLSDIESLIRARFPFIENDDQSFSNWVCSLMPRNEYLSIIRERVIAMDV